MSIYKFDHIGIVVDDLDAALDHFRKLFEIRDAGRTAVLDLSSASGASVAEVLGDSAPEVGRKTGVAVTVRDVNPLQRGDPRGLAIFYISLAAVIIGFVGAIQLSVHARTLTPFERILFTLAYALLGGFAIAATVDWLLGALDLPFAESWLILALTLFTSGMVFTMFNALVGRWAMLPTWGLMVLLGNPSSGGAVYGQPPSSAPSTRTQTQQTMACSHLHPNSIQPRAAHPQGAIGHSHERSGDFDPVLPSLVGRHARNAMSPDLPSSFLRSSLGQSLPQAHRDID